MASTDEDGRDWEQTTLTLRRGTSLSGPWTETICQTPDNINCFHIEMHRARGKWYCLTHHQDYAGRGQLVWLESADGITWTGSESNPQAIHYNGLPYDNTDHGFYKSSAVAVGGIWKLYNASDKWTVGVNVTDMDGELLPAGYLAEKLTSATIATNFAWASDRALNTTWPAIRPGTETWQSVNNAQSPFISANTLVKSATNASTARINLGTADGIIGVRYSALNGRGDPNGSRIWVEFRAENATSVNRLYLIFSDDIWTLIGYDGSFTNYARFYTADMGGDGLSPMEIVIKFLGDDITVWLNGQIALRQTVEMHADNTWVGLGFNSSDVGSIATGFFADRL
jgi:hypothetical protein